MINLYQTCPFKGRVVQLLYLQPAYLALILNPAKAMADKAWSFAMITLPGPCRSPVISAVPFTGDKRCQRESSWFGEIAKAVKHRLNLRLRGVHRDHLAKNTSNLQLKTDTSKAIIVIESRSFGAEQCGGKHILDAVIQHFTIALDTVIALGLEKSHQPVSGPERSAADVEDLGRRPQTLPNQRGKTQTSYRLKQLRGPLVNIPSSFRRSAIA